MFEELNQLPGLESTHLLVLSHTINTNLETAILNLYILDNKIIHQAPLVSAQLAVALAIIVRATARIKISTRRR